MLWAAVQLSGMHTSPALHHASTVQYPNEQAGMTVNMVRWLTCLAPVLQLPAALLHVHQQTGQQKSLFHQVV